MNICFNPKILVLYKDTDTGKYKKKLFNYNGEHQEELENLLLNGEINHIFTDRPDLKIRDDYEKLYIIPCGKCYNCRKRQRQEWRNRIELENNNQQKIGNNAYFITLTYDDEHLPKDLKLHKEDFQNFMKKYRQNTKEDIKYYACGEYGDRFQRPHYHAIIWIQDDLKESRIQIQKSWNKGRIQVDMANPGTIAYVAGYVDKKLNKDTSQEFTLMSKGIGKLNENDKEKIYQNKGKIYLRNGNITNCPRYERLQIQEKYEDFKKIRDDIYNSTANKFYNEYLESGKEYYEFTEQKKKEQERLNKSKFLSNFNKKN